MNFLGKEIYNLNGIVILSHQYVNYHILDIPQLYRHVIKQARGDSRTEERSPKSLLIAKFWGLESRPSFSSFWTNLPKDFFLFFSFICFLREKKWCIKMNCVISDTILIHASATEIITPLPSVAGSSQWINFSWTRPIPFVGSQSPNIFWVFLGGFLAKIPLGAI